MKRSSIHGHNWNLRGQSSCPGTDRKTISEILDNCPLEVFSNGEELLDYLSDRKQRFSLYFMDISLPGISGIETAAAIREKDPYALIIYITDYKEYVYQGF